ncbi:ATP-binding protein [Paenibacillus sp. LjRoot153]|uniref:AlbA family DNA-binding domain-containing protein n=1 Tax=Paenibacillus sp. LjRoot153 TaxID=3342270 RepID=UPI003ECE1C21
MDLLDIIQFENEHTSVDFKMISYEKKQNKKEDFLKDLLAMANAEVNGQRYLIIGVKLLSDGQRSFHSIEEYIDDANYQELVRENIEPQLNFRFDPIRLNEYNLGVFTIGPCENKPYMMKKDCGTLKRGMSYIRRGSQQKLIIRTDLENIYEDRYKKRKEAEIKESYLYLLEQEFRYIQAQLWQLKSLVVEGPLIEELWSPAYELANHLILEAWEAIVKSGLISTIDFDEMETYHAAVKSTRAAFRNVCLSAAKWPRFLQWDKNIEKGELTQIIPPNLYLKQEVDQCKRSISYAEQAIMKAIERISIREG